MKCFLPNFPSEKAVELMRWLGYATHREDDGSMSFVRSPFAPEARWPRFHVSVFSKDSGLQINIHIDQEDARRHGTHQFVWAYRNPLVMEEGQRFEKLLDKAKEVFASPAVSFLSPPVRQTVRQLSKRPANVYSNKIIIFLSKQRILCRFF